MTNSKLLFFSLFALIFLTIGCKNDPKTIAPVVATDANNAINPELQALTLQLQLSPKNDSLLFKRASVFYKLEGYDGAITDLTAAIMIDSMQPKYYHLLSDVFMDYTKSYQAVKTMEVAVSKFPNRIPTLLKASENYLIIRKHSEALKLLNKIMLLDPQNSEALYMSGRVALDMGKTNEAIASLRQSVKINADNPDAWEFLGRIYSEKNDPVALQYFDNALRLDSTNTDLRIYKAMFYKQKGDFPNAFRSYKEIVNREPDNADAFYDMGIMYLELDSLDAAYSHFDISIKRDPLFVKAYYYRGVVSEQKGDKNAAIADYKQANKMSPNLREANDALARLGLK
jgi:tetratricopeptide (TPR) repeat protein